jgi:hypothetical protein
MTNKKAIKKDNTKGTKPNVNPVNKKSITPDNGTDTKKKNRRSQPALSLTMLGVVQ